MEYIKPIKQSSKQIYTSFTFLDVFKSYINVEDYYIFLDELSIRDINNIYNLCYLYWCQMIFKGVVSIKNTFIQSVKLYTKQEIDKLFCQFINDNSDNINMYCKCIYIMNVIQSNWI